MVRCGVCSLLFVVLVRAGLIGKWYICVLGDNS